MLKPYLLLSLFLLAAGPAGSTAATEAGPLNPIVAMLQAFQSHPIVALAEGRHNNEQGYRLESRKIPLENLVVDHIEKPLTN